MALRVSRLALLTVVPALLGALSAAVDLATPGCRLPAQTGRR